MPQDHLVIQSTGGSYWMGGREYTRNLIRALLSLPESERAQFKLTVLVDGQSEVTHYQHFANSNIAVVESELAQPRYTLGNRIAWKAQRVLGGPFNPRLQEYLTSIGTSFAYPLMTAPRDKQPFRSAVWIPDFQFKHFPDGAPESFIRERKADGQYLATHAQVIVLSSQHAEADCLELYPSSQGRTFVLRFRVSIEESAWQQNPIETVTAYHLPTRFFLVSNLLAPTKNHDVVIEALYRLKNRRTNVCVVFTGDLNDYRNPGFYNQFLAKIHRYGLHEQVRVLGLIPKNHQFQLLRTAQALIQPSFFEGWHTGVEEAQYVGQRLLISDIPVHREQNPPQAKFFDCRQPEHLAELLAEMADQPQMHDTGREQQARMSYLSKVNQYARDFLQLARICP